MQNTYNDYERNGNQFTISKALFSGLSNGYLVKCWKWFVEQNCKCYPMENM